MNKKSVLKYEKLLRITEIKEMVHNFCEQHLNEDL